jgi:phenylacetyl-CoA:acceptor oxidoreductase
VPIVGHNGAWSQALGPTQLAWMFQRERPDDWTMPMPTLPEVWLIYRSNPAISFWDTRHLAEIAATFPFMACFAYTVDETNYMADVLLPEATDLESAQMIRMGGTKYMEQFWDHKGVVLRQPRRSSRRARRATSPGSPPNWRAAPACSSPTSRRSTRARPASRR